MRIVGLALCAFTLSGCADNYSVAPGGPASELSLKADIKDCRDWASDQYLWVQGHGGGLVGGAMLAAASSTSTSDINRYGPIDGRSKPTPTLDQMIQSCMNSRGYTGSSKTG